jgi:putative transposase
MSVQSNSIFGRLANQFRNSDSLFFDSQLSIKAIQNGCLALGHEFRDRIYSPAVTVWMFIGQVLLPDHSCRDAISRLNVWRVARGMKPASIDTASYVEARQRLPEQLLLDLAKNSAKDCVSQTRSNWLWKDRVVKTVDGFTVTMPDTVDNQREYPQSKSQKPGVGFPIVRVVMIFSLAVGVALEIALGKYSGKQVGETSLLRSKVSTVLPGEVLLADCYYATYWLLATAWQNAFDLVCKSHHRRKVDFRRGIKLGALDQIVSYAKPSRRPYWMSVEEYEAAPEAVFVRHLRYQVTQPGFRTRTIVIATTMLNHLADTVEDIADLFRQRWQVEIDIRSLKTHMKMEHLRCMSPEMVRKEIYCHMLAYNLVRRTIVESASIFNKLPRQLSFKGAVQALNAFMSALAACGSNIEKQYQCLLLTVSENIIGDRPDRIEPRKIKRRPKPYKLLNEPRSKARKRAA